MSGFYAESPSCRSSLTKRMPVGQQIDAHLFGDRLQAGVALGNAVAIAHHPERSAVPFREGGVSDWSLGCPAFLLRSL